MPPQFQRSFHQSTQSFQPYKPRAFIMSFQTIRRGLVASTLVLAGSVVAAPAMADTVNLNGSVADTSAVTSTRTTEAGTLNLYGVGTAQPDVVVKVADMALITNNADGVTLTATATGNLVNVANNATPLAYRVLIVGDSAVAPAATAFLGTTHNVPVTDFAAGASARDLYIEYDAPALLDFGSYTSTITVSVAAL